MHTQVASLVGKRPSLPVNWRFAIQQYYRVIVDPL